MDIVYMCIGAVVATVFFSAGYYFGRSYGLEVEKITAEALDYMASLKDEIERARLKLVLAQDSFVEEAFLEYRARLEKVNTALEQAYKMGREEADEEKM